jgi:hypothetical protein
MESQTSLVGAKSRVELHTISTVDLEDSLVIFPDHAELDDAFWDGDDREGNLILGVLLEQRAVLKGAHKLCGKTL